MYPAASPPGTKKDAKRVGEMSRGAVSARTYDIRWMEGIASGLARDEVLEPVILEKRLARRYETRVARGRWLLSRGGVAAVAIALAAWAGSLLGSGALDSGARFNAERLAAQSGVEVLYGPAAVPGHPGATTMQRQDLIRQFIALDGVN